MGITLACAIIFAPKDPKKEITFGTVSYTIVFNIVALVFGYLITPRDVTYGVVR